MGKIEINKKAKMTSLLDAAYKLFTTQGVNKTSVSEISKESGIAKGTFYLYFKDKYDIRNKLISHESSKLFTAAKTELLHYQKDHNISFEDQIIFIVDHIVNALNANQSLLTFISKNLSWGIFKQALTSNISDNDINFKHVFESMINECEQPIYEPEVMIFMITELVSSTIYSAILYKEPVDLEHLKPHLYSAIRGIIQSHMCTSC
ncbi:MAG: TetR/AcrR family transcriptional regulator [Lachnospira sp.]|jgi:AcrR family transcriptional regulator|nr:TetR/AcrR family transcriptional regulator [Lachnospira sp.]